MSTADALQAWGGGLITSQSPPGVPLALCIALVTSLLYGLYRLCGDKDGLSHLPLPPSVAPWPLDDGWSFLTGTLFEHTAERFARFGGKPFLTRLFGARTINVYEYKHVRKVLALEHDAVEADWMPSTARLLGERSVSVTKFAAHTRMRKALAPSFTARRLDAVLPRLVKIVQSRFQAWAAAGSCEIVAEVRELTYHVMASVMMGLEGWKEDGRLSRSAKEFDTWLAGLFVPDIYLPGTPFRRSLASRQALMAMIGEAVRERRAAASNEQLQQRGTILDGILAAADEEGEPLSDEAVADVVLNLLFAGHDTSASTLMYGMWLLAEHHPAVLARLREEQAGVVTAHGADVTPEALKDMPYTSAVVNELLRYNPIVQVVPRKAQRTFEIDGFRVPEGCQLHLHIAHVTHSLACTGGASGPERFDPDRWLRPGEMDPRAFMPFGGGARMCPGYPLAKMEITVMLAELARGYEWSAEGGTSVAWVGLPILRPAGNKLHLEFRERSVKG